MSITQLEYIVAVYRCRNFAQAADSCFVTQPTLSMQIQKLEEELGVLIFDRSKKPVQPTHMGELILKQAMVTIQEFNKIAEMVKADKGEVSGQLTIGIIPTIAPYLVPLFILPLLKKHPDLDVKISEMTTTQIIQELGSDKIDCGILATPLGRKQIIEEPIYYEPLVVYVSPKHKLSKNKTLRIKDISNQDLLMLTEEHCLNAQIKNLCVASNVIAENSRFSYMTGSLETIKQMVELSNGITLLPELATQHFSVKQMNMLRYFREVEPVREISIVTYAGYRKDTTIDALKAVIADVIPSKMKDKKKKTILDVEN